MTNQTFQDTSNSMQGRNDDLCQGDLHPRAVTGLEFFNRGLYFEAHEELEAAWRAERGPIRDLYRAILQIGLGYRQIQRQRYVGAVKMFRRCKRWLEPFADNCLGIDLGKLREDYLAVEAELLRLGPNGIEEFPLELIKPVAFETPAKA